MPLSGICEDPTRDGVILSKVNDSFFARYPNAPWLFFEVEPSSTVRCTRKRRRSSNRRAGQESSIFQFSEEEKKFQKPPFIKKSETQNPSPPKKNTTSKNKKKASKNYFETLSRRRKENFNKEMKELREILAELKVKVVHEKK
jgi:hypothetical protein